MRFTDFECSPERLSTKACGAPLDSHLPASSRTLGIDTVDFSEDSPVKGWIAGIDFLVLLFRQVFKNKDDSTGILYLVCSDLNSDAKTLSTLYKKRWKVEVFHT